LSEGTVRGYPRAAAGGTSGTVGRVRWSPEATARGARRWRWIQGPSPRADALLQRVAFYHPLALLPPPTSRFQSAGLSTCRKPAPARSRSRPLRPALVSWHADCSRTWEALPRAAPPE